MAVRAKRKKGFSLRVCGFFMVIAGVLALLIILDNGFRPLIKTRGKSRAMAVCNVIINNAVIETLETSDFTYDSLVDIQRSQTGDVTSINSNMVNLNAFKAIVTNKIQSQINDYEKQTVSIPIGTVIGGDFFVGRGPSISFNLDMSCNVRCEISNLFDDAGINQTRHQIMLNISTDVYIIIPGYNTTATLESNFIIAETVIVGSVPEYYTSVVGSEDVAGDINDYGAEISDIVK